MSAATWVLVADGSGERARLLATRPGEGGFEAVADHEHTELAAEPGTEGPENPLDQFARQVAEDLESARRALRYERLYVVAPPKLLGTLRRFYGAQTQRALREEINCDLAAMEGPALTRQLTRLIPR